MSDSEKNLEIKITTSADDSGADQAAKSLEKTGEAAKHLGKEVSGAGDAAKEGEHKFLGLNTEIGEQRKAVEGLKEAMPGLIEAFNLFTNPAVAGVSLVVEGYLKLQESIDETNKLLEESAEAMARPFQNMREAIADVRRDIKFTRDEYTAALKEMGKAEDELKSKIDLTIDSIKRKEQAQIALTDAQEALALAQVRAEQKLGVLTEDQAAAAELEIKKQAERRRIDEQNKSESKVVAQKQGELSTDILEQYHLQDLIKALGAGKDTRDAKLKDLPGEIKKREDDLAEQDKAIAKQKAEVEEHEAATERLRAAHRYGFGSDSDVASSEAYTQSFRDKLKDLQDNRARSATALDTSKDELAKYQLEQKNYEDSQAALEKIKITVRDLTAEVQKLQDAARDNSAQREQLFQIHSQTEALDALPSMVQGTGAAVDKIDSAMREHTSNVQRLIGIATSNNATAQQHSAAIQKLQEDAKRGFSIMKHIEGQIGQGY